MIDITNKQRRYINTPGGIAEIDIYTEDSVWVWLGERDRRTNIMRPHEEYKFDECEEVEE